MLQRIRDRSQSMIAKTIVGVVIVALALFGIESIVGLINGGGDDIAEVNGETITRQQVEMEVQRALRSGQVPPERERELRSQVIDQLLTRVLLSQYAEQGGLYASESQLDNLIVNLPEFQDQEGRFSTQLFTNRLASAGYTPLAFREQLKGDIIRQQVQQGLASSAFLLDSERQRLEALQRQTRSFRYHQLTREAAADDIEVSEDDLQAYYDAHQERYLRPEQVRLEYVILDQADMAAEAEVDEDTLREHYAQRQREAERRVSHIMVSFGDERTYAEAEARLSEARERLEAGDDFAELAAEYSEDTATAENDGDLGYISRGFFGDAFEDAAFSLDQGEVSSIVETENGLHLIKATELDMPTFEEMRDELREGVALSLSQDRFNERAQRLIDESFAADDLASVANDLELELHESDWVSREHDEGVLAEPGIMEAAFDPEVLEEGYNSEVIELDDQRRMVLRVAEHRSATTLSLDEVREDVHEAALIEKANQALRERASALAESLRNGDQPSLDWQEAEDVSRQQSGDIPGAILQRAFRLAHPEQGETVYGQAMTEQGIALIALHEVAQGGDSASDQVAFVAQLTERLRAQAAVQGLLEDLRANAEIERH